MFHATAYYKKPRFVGQVSLDGRALEANSHALANLFQIISLPHFRWFSRFSGELVFRAAADSGN
ncbi:MAG: hypothetical protein GX621_11350 [Pirellulaceae bacterium]|nr:hypothetical protein [Pirellulaceae bacterium]